MSLETEAANMKDILLLTKLYRSHIATLCGVHAALFISLYFSLLLQGTLLSPALADHIYQANLGSAWL